MVGLILQRHHGNREKVSEMWSSTRTSTTQHAFGENASGKYRALCNSRITPMEYLGRDGKWSYSFSERSEIGDHYKVCPACEAKVKNA